MIALQDQVADGVADVHPAAGPAGSVVDLFCGAGGLSHGFRLEGFNIVAGIDIDQKCKYPFEANNAAPFLLEDVAKIDSAALNARFLCLRAGWAER